MHRLSPGLSRAVVLHRRRAATRSDTSHLEGRPAQLSVYAGPRPDGTAHGRTDLARTTERERVCAVGLKHCRLASSSRPLCPRESALVSARGIALSGDPKGGAQSAPVCPSPRHFRMSFGVLFAPRVVHPGAGGFVVGTTSSASSSLLHGAGRCGDSSVRVRWKSTMMTLTVLVLAGTDVFGAHSYSVPSMYDSDSGVRRCRAVNGRTAS